MKSILGTELKMNVHLEPIDGMHMSDYEFECLFFVYRNRTVCVPKGKMRMIDEDNYIAVIESDNALSIGRGQVKAEITAHIPDSDFSDGLRTEKLLLCTDVTII